MPYDITYRDKDGQIRSATVHSLEDTADGFVRIERSYNTVIDPGTTTKYIPKQDIVDIKGPRDPAVTETDFHPTPGDLLRKVWDKIK